MDHVLEIGIVGDHNPRLPSHRATAEALGHAAGALGASIACAWVGTRQVEDQGPDVALARFQALWCAPGSPYESMAGALHGIRYARETGRPFLGT